jgi:hypothetical protein
VKTISGMMTGPLDIIEDTDISGMVTGKVRVGLSCRLRVSGMVTGKIYLAKGAEVDIPGMFNGKIIRR